MPLLYPLSPRRKKTGGKGFAFIRFQGPPLSLPPSSLPEQETECLRTYFSSVRSLIASVKFPRIDLKSGERETPARSEIQ